MKGCRVKWLTGLIALLSMRTSECLKCLRNSKYTAFEGFRNSGHLQQMGLLQTPWSLRRFAEQKRAVGTVK